MEDAPEIRKERFGWNDDDIEVIDTGDDEEAEEVETEQ